MSSPAQITANRANAQLSTGPRTDAGKAASSRNHTSHGLFTSFDHLRPHDRERYDSALDINIQRYQCAPEDAVLLSYLQELSYAQFRIARVQSLSSGCLSLITGEFREQLGWPEQLTPAQHDELEARAFLDESRSKHLKTLHRWERDFRRDAARTLQQIERLLAERAAAAEAEAEEEAAAAQTAADQREIEEFEALYARLAPLASSNPMSPGPTRLSGSAAARSAGNSAV